jgi:hypothetical protein
MKKYASFGIAFVIILIVWFVGSKMGDAAKDKAQVQCQQQVIIEQKQEIKVKNEVVKAKKIIKKRIIQIRDFSTNDNFTWVRENRCPNCRDK